MKIFNIFWQRVESNFILKYNLLLNNFNQILFDDVLWMFSLTHSLCRFSLSFADTYDIFIDSGGSPDAYLSSADINSFLNDSFIFNGTLDAIVNGTIQTHENIIDKNSTKLTNTNATDEDVAELVIMAVTSIVLGLMILITVIGNKTHIFMYTIFPLTVWLPFRSAACMHAATVRWMGE